MLVVVVLVTQVGTWRGVSEGGGWGVEDARVVVAKGVAVREGVACHVDGDG